MTFFFYAAPPFQLLFLCLVLCLGSFVGLLPAEADDDIWINPQVESTALIHVDVLADADADLQVELIYTRLLPAALLLLLPPGPPHHLRKSSHGRSHLATPFSTRSLTHPPSLLQSLQPPTFPRHAETKPGAFLGSAVGWHPRLPRVTGFAIRQGLPNNNAHQ